MFIRYLLLLFLVLPARVVSAQEIIFSAQAAARKVGLHDPFEFQFSIKNAREITSFNPPNLNDFQILSGPNKNIRYIDNMYGERTISFDLTYVLKAKKTGSITIGPALAEVDGHKVRSNQVSIDVIKGSVIDQQVKKRQQQDPFAYTDPFDDPFFADPFGEDPFELLRKQQQRMQQLMQRHMQGDAAPRASSPSVQVPITKSDIHKHIFLQVEADKRNVYLGEQINVSYKLYTRVPMEMNITKHPSLLGFWSQDFAIPNPPQPVKEVYQGKEYQVFEIKRTALFPTQSGKLTLDAAKAEGKVRIYKHRKNQSANDPFFDSFFGSLLLSDPTFGDVFSEMDYEDITLALSSQPIEIQVNELPLNQKPASFKGAVGKYQLDSYINDSEITTDDVATIRLRVSGTGNLKLIGVPELKVPEQLQPFDPTYIDSITSRHNIIAGYKEFTYTYSTSAPGTYTIPPGEFSYFDPEQKSYHTLTTPPYTLHVLPGESNTTAKKKLPTDIHDIESDAVTLHKSHGKPLPFSPLYWSGFLLPVLVYMGLIASRRSLLHRTQNMALYRNRHADKIALKRLETANKYLRQNQQNLFYEEVSKALWLYLSDKLHLPLSSLSKEVASIGLQQKKVDAALLHEWQRLTGECEMALYTPDKGTLQMHQVYADTLKLIGQLETALS